MDIKIYKNGVIEPERRCSLPISRVNLQVLGPDAPSDNSDRVDDWFRRVKCGDMLKKLAFL